MARLHVLDPDPRVATRWRLARHAAVAGLLALLVTLVLAPQPALTSLWYVAVPLLPASYLISPALWRGICPLSTLNAWGNRLGAPRELTEKEAAAFGVAGLVLFHVIVPARHIGLNTNGPLLAGALGAIGALALVSGARFASRSAFCNALCPVLPVERLYGQAPLVPIRRGRCDSCTVCTPRGCIDLADDKSMRQVLGPARNGGLWLGTSFGFFAAALPGFIAGYGLTPDVAAGNWMRVYGATLGGSLLSYALIRAIVRGFGIRPMRAIAGCAALSGVAYYWFTAPVVVRSLGLVDIAIPAIRTLAILGVIAWAVRTLKQEQAAA